MKSIDELVLVSFQFHNEWKITYNQLYDLDPCHVNQYSDAKYPLAGMCFVEDLLQIENNQKQLMIDVGWYPDGDLNDGEYKLVVISKGNGIPCWEKPIEEYKTISLSDLLEKINTLTIIREDDE